MAEKRIQTLVNVLAAVVEIKDLASKLYSPVDVGSLKPARGSGERCKLPQ